MSVLVTFGVAVVAALWGIAVYNRLIGLRKRVTRAWTALDEQSRRRHDLVVNLVNIVKGAAAFEADALAAVIAARSHASDAMGPADAGRKEGELTAALGRLLTLIEGHPSLAHHQQVRALLEGIAAADRPIVAAREAYNTTAAAYNAAIQALPGNLVAAVAGFHKAEAF
jgi:LemA protein